MHEIVYISQAKSALDPSELFRIIEQSARNNPTDDITGFLIYRGGRFLQLIEGPLENLEALLHRLGADSRHHSLRVLSHRAIDDRSFPRWRMKRLGESGDALAEVDEAFRSAGRSAAVPLPVREFCQAPLAA